MDAKRKVLGIYLIAEYGISIFKIGRHINFNVIFLVTCGLTCGSFCKRFTFKFKCSSPYLKTKMANKGVAVTPWHYACINVTYT